MLKPLNRIDVTGLIDIHAAPSLDADVRLLCSTENLNAIGCERVVS